MGDILESLRLTGGVILEGTGRGDWCVLSRMEPEDCAELFPGGGPVIAYHFVRSGRLYAQLENSAPRSAEAGSILLFPRNDPHRLYTAPCASPVDSHQFVAPGPAGRLASFVIGSDGEQVDFYCGFLGVAGEHHPLLDCLPPLMVIDDVPGRHGEWLEGNLRFLSGGEATPDAVARVAELLFAHAVRAYVESLPPGEGGWLAGLRDPAVARALAIIHSRFADELDIEHLAREVGVSRTVLGERFAATLGEPPMRYCAHWRMRVAANMLRSGKESAASVAYAVGFHSEAAFNRAFKREYGLPPVAWKKSLEEKAQARSASAGLPRQEVRYCHARDGTRLAYSVVGKGFPLVKTANWLNHLEFDWESPLWRPWLTELTRDHCLIRYDERGNGLSDWDSPELSLEAFVEDLRAVVDCLELERFDLLAISQGAAVAVAFAVRYPERVRRLAICNGYAAGWRVRAQPDEVAAREAMVTLTRIGWGLDDPTYRQIFTNRYVPEATHRQMDWFNDMQRHSASPENAVKLQEVLGALDVRHLLHQVRTPTLIAHTRGDQAVPFSQGEELAAGIPGARFMPLEGRNHILLDTDPSWPVFFAELRSFLRSDEGPATRAAALAPKSSSVAPADRIALAMQSEELGRAVSRDGSEIGYSVAGEGFPLAVPAVWYQEVASDWTSPVWQHWLAELLVGRRLIRSDLRGFGSSGPRKGEWSLDHLIDDLCCVIDMLRAERFDLVAFAHGSLPALALAARQPERVRKLVIVGGYAQGFGVRGDPDEIRRRDSLTALARNYKGMEDGTFAQMLGTLYWPGARGETVDWLRARLKVVNQIDEDLQEVLRTADLKSELGRITAETLLLHSKGDQVVNIACAQEAAAEIAGAKLVPLDSDSHLVIAKEPAWTVARQALRSFLDR